MMAAPALALVSVWSVMAAQCRFLTPRQVKKSVERFTAPVFLSCHPGSIDCRGTAQGLFFEMTGRSQLWWRDGVFYQIYPRSYQDSNGDGVGDIRGIIERLPYVSALGVDAIWLSPIFPSPMADFGYDISDYVGVDSLFGTKADFDTLVSAAHAAGLKVILDLVPNHTSDQHP